ncbi:MAG: sphingomyelin synthase family protein [Cyclobacteriaceae bacterium]|nr:sphingomyelin synthase family protein [Cyclobacteriaceae bacterium]
MSEFRNAWKEAFQAKVFRYQFIGVLVSLIAVLIYLPTFFNEVIGPKKGLVLNDFVMGLFTPQDYSWPIFLLIYASLSVVVQGVINQPAQILFGLMCYLLITLLRMITMYVFTLEPPIGIVILHDPLIDKIAYGGSAFTKDLFFSGHVATLTLLTFLERRLWVKWFVLLATLVVGFLLIIQRVHYTIDVVVAPVMVVFIALSLKRMFRLS